MEPQVAQWVKNPPANAGDTGDSGWFPGSGRSPGEGNGNSLQVSCLRNPMDRGAWQAIVHEVTKSWTRKESKSNDGVTEHAHACDTGYRGTDI